MQKELFALGQVVRYSQGSTALIQVATIMEGHGGSKARYYGPHCMGGTQGFYHEDAQPASEEDIQKWHECEIWRRDTKQVPMHGTPYYANVSFQTEYRSPFGTQMVRVFDSQPEELALTTVTPFDDTPVNCPAPPSVLLNGFMLTPDQYVMFGSKIIIADVMVDTWLTVVLVFFESLGRYTKPIKIKKFGHLQYATLVLDVSPVFEDVKNHLTAPK